MSFLVALFFSAAVGYVTLSQEIVWMRLVGYASGGRPDVFAHVLAAFLLGIALGAARAERACARGEEPTGLMARLLICAAAVYYASVVMAGVLSGLGGEPATTGQLGVYLLLAGAAAVAYLTGGVFPLLCHVAIGSSEAVGLRVSWLYLANIAGSTAGPLVTGFVLLDLASVEDLVLALTAATLLLGVVFYAAAPGPRRPKLVLAGALAVTMGGVALAHSTLTDTLLEALQFSGGAAPYKYEVQNKSGIIAVEADANGDIIYGGGAYDGRFNTDPVVDSNGIRRGYMMAALHANPERVLEIGLSSGSWTSVIASHRKVKKLDVVEINPGYVQLIRNYPEHAAVLDDPKVTLHFDDGRRWLLRHAEARFDFILMNTTHHWRSNITALLSVEFLALCKNRLLPRGVLYYNTTHAEEVPFTAAHVFRHVTRYGSFVAASDTPFAMTPAEAHDNLLGFVRDGAPLFQRDLAHAGVLRTLSEADRSDQGPALRARTDLLLITDRNMATEFKRGRGLYDPTRSWWALFARRSAAEATAGRASSR